MSDKTTPPVRHHGNGILQTVSAETLAAQEAEERPQRGRHQLDRPWLVATRCRANELDDSLSIELTHLHSPTGEALLQERPNEPGVVHTSPFADASCSPK